MDMINVLSHGIGEQKMLSKEECEQVLMNICSSNSRIEDRKVFKDLINEHFELVEKYEMLDNTYSMICEDFLNTQPYKFEDLKEGLWVWDKSYQEVCYIGSIVSKEKIYCEYLESHCSIEPYIIMPFEENRFYPVYIAK